MNCSHPREEECVSRRPAKISSGGSDNRIEPEAGNQEFVFHSEYRPVGYEREQKDFIVLLSLIRTVKLDSQCTQGAMEQNVCLFISSISVDPLVPQKVLQEPSVLVLIIDCFSFSETVMVSNCIRTSGGDPNPKKTIRHVTWVSKSCYMDHLMSALCWTKISPNAQKHIKRARRASAQHTGCFRQDFQFTELVW